MTSNISGMHRIVIARSKAIRSGLTPKRRKGVRNRVIASSISEIRVVRPMIAAKAIEMIRTPHTTAARCHPATTSWNAPMKSNIHSAGRSCRIAVIGGMRAIAYRATTTIVGAASCHGSRTKIETARMATTKAKSLIPVGIRCRSERPGR
jgi:hypothetical protein